MSTINTPTTPDTSTSITLDDPNTWRDAAQFAMARGIADAENHAHAPMTGLKLVAAFAAGRPLYIRVGYASYLRNIYLGAFRGAKLGGHMLAAQTHS